MKGIGLTLLYGAILFGSWELQKVDLLLGYTLGVFGILGATILTVDYLARKYL
jgi:hypothetical protein